MSYGFSAIAQMAAPNIHRSSYQPVQAKSRRTARIIPELRDATLPQNSTTPVVLAAGPVISHRRAQPKHPVRSPGTEE